MTHGPTPESDALLLRDLARAGGPDGIAKYPQSDVDSVALVEAADDAADLAHLDRLKAWILTVLDRVPEAYGDRDKPERIIDLWLDDLTNLHAAVKAWREWAGGPFEPVPGKDGPWLDAHNGIVTAFDRIRTDEEENTDGES